MRLVHGYFALALDMALFAGNFVLKPKPALASVESWRVLSS